jgi:hypothetical protein
MQLRLIVTAATALALAAPAAAQESPNPTDTSAPAAKEKKICKRQIATGSIMSRPICHTKAEWAAISARNQADGDHLRDLQSASPTNRH